MDADLIRIFETAPPGPGDAIQQIVQVFRDGCRAAESLRHTSDDLTASELGSRLTAIEVRMLRQISVICEEFLIELPAIPRN